MSACLSMEHITDSGSCDLNAHSRLNGTHRHTGCMAHYHTMRMMQRHEHEDHPCPSDCPACAAIREHREEFFRESARSRYAPQCGTSKENQTTTTAAAAATAQVTQTGNGTSTVLSALYGRMVDEQEKVQEGQLVPLPRTPSVHDLLGAYLQHLSEEQLGTLGLGAKQVAALLRGTEVLFNVALGRVLLYKEERTQLARLLEQQRVVRAPVPEPAHVYGAEHLARMLAWLPEFVADINEVDEHEREHILRLAESILVFLAEHLSEYWTSTYTRASDSTTSGRRGGGGSAAGNHSHQHRQV